MLPLPPVESLAVTVTEYVPPVVGVPSMVAVLPAPGVSVSPAGRPVADQLTAREPESVADRLTVVATVLASVV